MLRSLPCLGLVIIAFALSTVAAPTPAPTTQPNHPYFPLTPGASWKYRVTTQVDDKPDKPYVQTITVGEPITAGGQILFPIDDDLYQVKSDGIYLFGRRDGEKITPLDEAQKIVSAKLRASDAWNTTAKGESTYVTCLGNQTSKTPAGEFTTQCVFSSTTGNDDTAARRQTYRYFARGVGLVRETSSEKTKRADGSAENRQITRELVAFIPAVEAAPPEVVKSLEPIGTDSLRGELHDAAGDPIAQAALSLRRLDRPGVQGLQTDVAGRFSAAGLDPAGSYQLNAKLIGYEGVEIPVRSTDRGAAVVTVQLKTSVILAAADEPKSAEALIAAGKKLALDGDHKAAVAKYSEALTQDPKNTTARTYKALSLLALGQARDAQQEVDEALRINDKEYATWEVAGQIKAAQNQSGQARALFDKAAKLSPKNAGAIYTDLAAALAAKNADALAGEIESALKAAADADPPGADALFQLGQSYANAGKPEGKTYLTRYLAAAAKLPEADQDKQKIQVAKQLVRALDALKQAK